jgi:hypothetical protein
MERREEMPKEDRRMRGRRERRNDERWRERKDELVGEGSAESRIEAGRKELERGGVEWFRDREEEEWTRIVSKISLIRILDLL